MVSGAPERGGRSPSTGDHVCDHGVDLAGRYRVGPLVRTDGRCCIHEGRDVLLQRPVSVTLATPEHGIPIPSTLPLPTSAQHLHGPGLGEIYDGGDDHGTLYLITQLPEGGSLAEELSRHHLSADEVRDLGAGIARALLPAHRRGWAHGALEADTVALGPDRVVVAGLGVGEWLAHWAQVEDRPRYPAPEQLADREVSPATDVFALGALLAEAAEPLPPTDPLAELLRRMRAEDPAERPGTEEVLRLLTDPDGFPAPVGAQVPLTRRRHPDARTAPTVAALGGLAVAAALALATLFVHASNASPEQVVGGATVASSSADPVLPGPLPLLIPPIARHAIEEERTRTAAATVDRTRSSSPDVHPAAATSGVQETAGTRETSDSGDTGSRTARPSSDTTSSDHGSRPTTTRHGDHTGDTGTTTDRPRPTSDPTPTSGRSGTGTRTTAPAGDDGTDPTTTHRAGTTTQRHADDPLTGTASASVTPTAAPDQDTTSY